jgi:hypothetical protein
MAISLDAIANRSAASDTTWNHTVGSGSNKILLVLLGMHINDDVTAVTFNGVSLSLYGEAELSYRRAQMWYLIDPPEGEYEVSITKTGTYNYASSGSISLFGVNQTNPFRAYNTANGTGYSPTVDVTSESGDLVIDIVSYLYLLTATAGDNQTQNYFDHFESSATSMSSREIASSATTTMSWSCSGNDHSWCSFAASLVPAIVLTFTGDNSLPSLSVVSGSDGVVESLPLFSLVNCYVDVPHSDVDESLPILTISATAIQSTVIAGDCTLPVLTISSLTGYQTDSELEVNLPLPTALASSLTGEIHQGDIDVPPLTISATLLNGEISQGVVTLPFLAFTGRTINTGTVSESVPVLTISAYAHGPLLHTLDESLPLLQIVANLVHASTAFRCYVLNTENSAITEYDNFPFNSFCTFKGKHLAAGSNGITLLEGNKDNSTDIKAYFNVGNNDFDLPNIKRITDAYLSMKGDGSYYLTVTSDDGSPHSYLLSATTGQRIKNIKTNVGKGKKGRFFELELSNIAGADFELFDMVLNVELLKRNI